MEWRTARSTSQLNAPCATTNSTADWVGSLSDMAFEMSNDPLASIRGLSEADAQTRLKTGGYNELPRPNRRTPLRIILEVMREPMLALLLGGGVIYLALGDLKEAVILLVFATMSVLITVVQETRTERVLEALRDLTSPRALVIRDGARKRIAGREVVRGDAVVLAEGDRVPADDLWMERYQHWRSCAPARTRRSAATHQSAGHDFAQAPRRPAHGLPPQARRNRHVPPPGRRFVCARRRERRAHADW